MEKTFIEDLWEKNPELVKDKLSEILDVEQERLIYDKKTKANGYLRFGIKSRYARGYEDGVIVNDYRIRFMQDKSRPEIVADWVSFMFENCGKPYAMQYISKRNKQLDKFMAEHKEKYNAETRTVLEQMGFDINKGQTK